MFAGIADAPGIAPRWEVSPGVAIQAIAERLLLS
jgi:hypothetical protein